MKLIAFYRLGVSGSTERIAIYGGEIPRTPYRQKGLIDFRGRYARVVPRPLAVRLAAMWWESTGNNRQQRLLEKMPENLVSPYCAQIETLDSHPNVKEISEVLCGSMGVFGSAEDLFTNRGSRLFRSFVIVNPVQTARALNRIFTGLSSEELLDVRGDVRRNLINAIERLCFHKDAFANAARCLLALAVAENEGWANNATGQFAQLYRVMLSGNAAPSSMRFQLLDEVLDRNDKTVDMVVINALKKGFDTFHGSRSIGAENQGLRSDLSEWKPDTWREIYEYWQRCLDYLLLLMKRGEPQKEEVVKHIGRTLRAFVSQGRISMLDEAIRAIVGCYGPYWPEALLTLKNVLHFDGNGLPDEVREKIVSWIALLDTTNTSLTTRLLALVVNPVCHTVPDENGAYVDESTQEAKDFARELGGRQDEVQKHLSLLLIGTPKKAYDFGREFALVCPKPKAFVESALKTWANLESPNSDLIRGLFRGLAERAPALWDDSLNLVTLNSGTAELYSHSITKGPFTNKHLDRLLELIKSGDVDPAYIDTIGLGWGSENVGAKELVSFSKFLIALDCGGEWPALRTMFSHYLNKKRDIDYAGEDLVGIVTSVPLKRMKEIVPAQFYQWSYFVEKMLPENQFNFAKKLSDQILLSSRFEIDYGNLWDYIKPRLNELMGSHWKEIWSEWSVAIAEADEDQRYWLEQLLAAKDKSPSVLASIPESEIINWCREKPEDRAAFYAKCINVFDYEDTGQVPSSHFISILEHFGNIDAVEHAISMNLGSRSWTGSIIPLLEKEAAALNPLLDHSSSLVRGWVREHLVYIEKSISREGRWEEERQLGYYNRGKTY